MAIAARNAALHKSRASHKKTQPCWMQHFWVAVLH
jgi:hypothetical protein